MSSDLVGSTSAGISAPLLASMGLLSSTDSVGSIIVVSDGGFLSFVASGVCSTSIIFDSDLFSLIADDGLLSFATGDAFPSAGSPALSQFGAPSRVCRPFLASLAALFARYATPITGKRLFDKVFIKQKPFNLIQ